MNKKPTNQLEIQQLLDLLKENPEENQTNQNRDEIYKFLSNYDLKPGDNRISGKLLYQLYKIGSIEHISESEFYSRLSLYLYKISNTKYYLVNKKLDFLSSKLYEYVEQTKHKKLRFRRNHFEKFLDRFDLKTGDIPNQYITLEKLYYYWIRIENPRAKTINKTKLPSHFKLYFKYKKTLNGIFYYLNKDVKTILKELNNAIQLEKEENKTTDS